MDDIPLYQQRLDAIDTLRGYPTQENYDKLVTLLIAHLLTGKFTHKGLRDYMTNADTYMADPTKDHPYAEL